MIQLDNVTKRYPGSHEILSNVNLSIPEGQMVYLTGHSGAGKSTLLKLIAAIEQPTRGVVLIANQNISKLKMHALSILRRRYGFVFQDHKLLYDRNCFENVALPLQINGLYGEDAAKRVRAALDKVGLLHKEKSLPISLSGGEQQRLAIARAVVSRPSVLIADEPTGNLDPNYATDIMRIFKAFNQVGVTVIVATHDPRSLNVERDQILHLHQGKLTSSQPNISNGART